MRGPRPTRPTFKPSRGPTENSEEKKIRSTLKCDLKSNMIVNIPPEKRRKMCSVIEIKQPIYIYIHRHGFDQKFPSAQCTVARNIVSTNANKIFLKWTTFMLCFLSADRTCLVFVLQYSLTSNSSVDCFLRISNNP